MFVAINKDKEKVHIQNASSVQKYFCPICSEELSVKKGELKAHHFAHKSNSNCTDKWHYDMSEWHYEWQNQFPLENQEVVFEVNGQKHRADVFISNTVIEFQHSNISKNEFEDRNNFYRSLGYKVIWVFDVISDYVDEKIYRYYSKNIYKWDRPRTNFYEFSDDSNIYIYLQCSENTWCIDKNFKLIPNFCDYSGDLLLVKKDPECKGMQYFEVVEKIDDIDFLKLFFEINKNNVFDKNINARNIKLELSDPIYMEKDYECITNYYGFCPNLKKYIKKSECIGCQYLDSYNRGCAFRFQKLLKNKIDKINYIEKDNEGRIKSVNLTMSIDYPELPKSVDSILNFWNKIDGIKHGVFFNTQTGWYVKVSNVSETLNKYGKVYGKFKGPNSSDYSEQSREVFDYYKDVWILEWYGIR